MSSMERINRRLPVLQSAYQDECEVEWHDMNEALALVYVAKEELEYLQKQLNGIGVEEYYALQSKCREQDGIIESLRAELAVEKNTNATLADQLTQEIEAHAKTRVTISVLQNNLDAKWRYCEQLERERGEGENMKRE